MTPPSEKQSSTYSQEIQTDNVYFNISGRFEA